ncbi:cyclic lactone autoinducer peptide [Desulfoscipio geothermicus]|uniref:Cyclic lactone autoinducer peptide n=1 Tax=Desulfoscipio geothermicus DSM 3669 TaxID=1121426 RepID=A0A1I6D0Z4_9FIRM|nr:cyclic lactone autoinducer peptide [Desulfoscipio geothermicus]SFQ98987.1 cyclic lactone autoinducer peptide [Desulfoscipio geothermicus DSM 3669]
MKKIISRFFIFTVTTLLFLASVTAASACYFSSYQPEVPEALRK